MSRACVVIDGPHEADAAAKAYLQGYEEGRRRGKVDGYAEGRMERDPYWTHAVPRRQPRSGALALECEACSGLLDEGYGWCPWCGAEILEAE